MSKAKTFHFLASAGAGFAVAVICYTQLRRKCGVLKDQNIKPKDFKRETIEQFLKEDKIEDLGERWERANELVSENSDLAGFLAFSTFEKYLREACNRYFRQPTNDRGLLSLAKKLRSAGAISRSTYETLKRIVCDVRNPINHGEVYCPRKLRASLCYINDFMAKHPISSFNPA